MMKLILILLVLLAIFIVAYYGVIAYFKHKIIKGTPPKIYSLEQLDDDLQHNVFSNKQIETFKRCFDEINSQLTGRTNSQPSDVTESLHQLETTLEQKQSIPFKDLVLVEFRANDTLNQIFDKPFTHKVFVSALKSATIGMYADSENQAYYAVVSRK